MSNQGVSTSVFGTNGNFINPPAFRIGDLLIPAPDGIRQFAQGLPVLDIQYDQQQKTYYYKLDDPSTLTRWPEYDLIPDIDDDTDASQPAAFTHIPLSADLKQFFLDQSADHEGHAQCTLALYPNKFAFCDAYGWLFFNGRFWQKEDAEAYVERAIVKTLQYRRIAAVKANVESLVRVCRGNNVNVLATKARLKAQEKIVLSVSDFDNNPDLLNVQNGVINLQNLDLFPHSPMQRFTYCLPVGYDAQADYGFWVDFLKDVTSGNDEVVKYLKTAVGYSLTGHTWEEILFYIHGPSRSGKGTFTETLIKLLGQPLATEADFQTFTADRYGDTQNFDLAPLKPCRFVAASESSKYAPLNPAKIKALTGGNYIRCAFKHRDHFSYRPQFKIWLSSNHPVNVDVDDDAAWGRVRVIEFPISHLDREDKTLKQRFGNTTCLQAILKWAVEGAQEWYQLPNGLETPETIKNMTRAQREARDYVQHFLEEMCIILQPFEAATQFLPINDLYKAYTSWCKLSGITPKGINGLSSALRDKGFQSTRIRDPKDSNRQKRVFYGLKLVDDIENNSSEGATCDA